MCDAVFESTSHAITGNLYQIPSIDVISRLSIFSFSIGTPRGAQTVKNLPAGQETQVQPLGQKDPLEKGMAVNSCILAWSIPWTEEPGGLQSMGSESDTTERLTLTTFM